MTKSFIVKHISIIFILATFTGFLHQHTDLMQHNDCKICTIQNTLLNADTPTSVVYITMLDIQPQAIINSPLVFISKKKYYTFSARAPPLFS